MNDTPGMTKVVTLQTLRLPLRIRHQAFGWARPTANKGVNCVNLYPLGRVLRRDLGWVIMIVVVALGGGGVVTAISPALYTSTTTALYSLETSGTLQTQLQSASLAAQRAEIDAQLVVTPTVLDPVIQETGVDTTAVLLASDTTALATATLVEITVTLPSPEDASTVAAAIVAELSDRASSETIVVDPTTADSPTYAYTVTTVDPALTPERPSSPNVLINMLVAVAVGVVAVALFLAWRLSTDRRVYDSEQVLKALGAPVLGTLPAEGETLGDEAAKLRTALLRREPPPAMILLAPAAAAKASAAGRALALSFAAASERPLLIEADASAASPRAGLTDYLAGYAAADDVIEVGSPTGVPTVSVGTVVGPAADLYARSTTERLLHRLVGDRAPVILVAAPVSRFADAAVLGGASDAVLVLVDRRRDTVDDLARAAEALRNAGVDIAGAVWSS